MELKPVDTWLTRLTPEEDALVQYFRRCTPQDQPILVEMVRTASQSFPPNVIPLRKPG